MGSKSYGRTSRMGSRTVIAVKKKKKNGLQIDQTVWINLRIIILTEQVPEDYIQYKIICIKFKNNSF